MIAVAARGLVPWRTWVPRFALVTGVLGLLGLAAINPDAWIARHNIERYEASGKLDVDYLATLSADAVPRPGDALPEPLSGPEALDAAGRADDDWLEWNLGALGRRRRSTRRPSSPAPAVQRALTGSPARSAPS